MTSVADVLRRIVAVQAVLVIAVAAVASVSVLTYRAADDRARDTEAVLLLLGTLRADVFSAETSLRGYALVEQDAFLVPYEQAFPDIDRVVAALRQRVDGDNRKLLDEAVDTVASWRTEFATVILGDLEHGRRDDALGLVATGAGRRRIDAFRSAVDELDRRTRSELAADREDADQWGVVGLVLATIALGALVVTVYAGRRRLDLGVAAPLESLADAASRFGAGDLGARAEPAGVAETVRVATAFNAMAARTERTVSELRALDRLKSEFVSVVSHELRTPLTSIRGSLGLVSSGAMGDLPPEAAEMLTIAVTNTDRLVRLINDILDLERIQAGQAALDIRACTVAALMADAAANVAGAADEAGVDVTVQPIDATIHADHDRLVQALTNLLANAIKFSERGSVVVLDGETRDREVVLRVRDHGRGIPADRLDDIFERFRQVDASDARAKGGTGLGLTIVRSIVERHGGRVEIESVPGVGSTFSLVLPRPRLPLEDGGEPDRASAVVLVEDDVDLRDVIRVGLDQHGIGVATASTAADAIERCRQMNPDVLILDVRLEEGSGYEVVRALRQDDRLRNLATVVYTVSDLTPEQRAALRLGETVFVTKGQQSSADLEREVLALLDRVQERPPAG